MGGKRQGLEERAGWLGEGEWIDKGKTGGGHGKEKVVQ